VFDATLYPSQRSGYVNETDAGWVSDWGAKALPRFDPKPQKVEFSPPPDRAARVRQLAGRKVEA
jgi:virginiamycin B lyase